MATSFEDRIAKARGPSMPPEMASRVREKVLLDLIAKPVRSPIAHFLNAKVLLLAALLITAIWVFQDQVSPVLREAWEMVHCKDDPGVKKP